MLVELVAVEDGAAVHDVMVVGQRRGSDAAVAEVLLVPVQDLRVPAALRAHLVAHELAAQHASIVLALMHKVVHDIRTVVELEPFGRAPIKVDAGRGERRDEVDEDAS